MKSGDVLSKLDKVMREIYTSEKKFLNDFIDLGKVLVKVKSLTNKKATPAFYSLLDQMISIAGKISETFRDDDGYYFEMMIKRSVNHKGVAIYKVDEKKLHEYFSEIKKLFEISKMINQDSLNYVNFSADCVSACNGKLITDEQKQGSPIKLIAPVQRLPRYKLLLEDAIKESSSDTQKNEFTKALSMIKHILADEATLKVKAAFSPDELTQMLRALEAVSDTVKDRKDRAFYLEKIEGINAKLKENNINDVCDLLFKITERASPRNSDDVTISNQAGVLSDAFNNYVKDKMEAKNWAPPAHEGERLIRFEMRERVQEFINKLTREYTEDANSDGRLLEVLQRHIYTSLTLDQMMYGLTQAMSPSRADRDCSDKYKQLKKDALSGWLEYCEEHKNIKPVQQHSAPSLRGTSRPSRPVPPPPASPNLSAPQRATTDPVNSGGRNKSSSRPVVQTGNQKRPMPPPPQQRNASPPAAPAASSRPPTKAYFDTQAGTPPATKNPTAAPAAVSPATPPGKKSGGL